MKSGNLNINPIALAPMAGICDIPFRLICKEWGAGYTVSEMISAKALQFNDKKTKELMRTDKNEHPVAIQIFGHEPDCMAQAAKAAKDMGADAVDINFGCPMPKITSNGDGSALLKNPKLCYEIMKAVKDAVDIPVTIKLRLGWDKDNLTALEISKFAQSAGIDCVIIHGRTRDMFYSGKAEYDTVKKIKAEISIPVFANGDITTPEEAKYVLDYTNCDGIMIGRGALGNPFIFKQINEYLQTGKYSLVSNEEKLQTAIKHIQLITQLKGEKVGILQARKHAAWYTKGTKNAASARCAINSAKTLNEMTDILKSSFL